VLWKRSAVGFVTTILAKSQQQQLSNVYWIGLRRPVNEFDHRRLAPVDAVAAASCTVGDANGQEH